MNILDTIIAGIIASFIAGLSVVLIQENLINKSTEKTSIILDCKNSENNITYEFIKNTYTPIMYKITSLITKTPAYERTIIYLLFILLALKINPFSPLEKIVYAGKFLFIGESTRILLDHFLGWNPGTWAVLIFCIFILIYRILIWKFLKISVFYYH